MRLHLLQEQTPLSNAELKSRALPRREWDGGRSGQRQQQTDQATEEWENEGGSQS